MAESNITREALRAALPDLTLDTAVEVVVIGAGQAGLAVRYRLTKSRREAKCLDAASLWPWWWPAVRVTPPMSRQTPFNIAISGAVSASFFNSDDRYECHYRLVLISSGGGARNFGRWVDGDVHLVV